MVDLKVVVVIFLYLLFIFYVIIYFCYWNIGFGFEYRVRKFDVGKCYVFFFVIFVFCGKGENEINGVDKLCYCKILCMNKCLVVFVWGGGVGNLIWVVMVL